MTKKKSIKVLSDDHLPQHYRSLVQQFDILNTIYTFINKRNMTFNYKNLRSILKSFGTNSNNTFLFNFTIEILITMSMIDPQSIEIIPSDDIDNIQINFPINKGNGKQQIGKRKTNFRSSLSLYLYNNFIVTKNTTSNEASSIWDNIVCTGQWPDTFGHTSELSLPNIDMNKYNWLTILYISSHTHTHNNTNSNTNSTESTPIKAPINKIIGHSSDLHLNPTIQHLLHSSIYNNQITHIEIIPSRQASYTTLNRPLLHDILTLRIQSILNITQYYTHQALGINALREGKHVVISTSTASGKNYTYAVY